MTAKSTRSIVLLVVAVVALVGVLGVVYLVMAGVSARSRPGAFETNAAHSIRNLAISMRSRILRNPVAVSAAIVTEGRDHFADHCAVCHGNDGSGNTDMGRGLYPRAPDMRQAATQHLSDGELFYIIENGIRLTGMPGWSTGTKEGETSSWHLVHFIRHLPHITEEEIEQMQSLNPKSPAEVRQEIAEEEFLRGVSDQETATAIAPHQHPGEHR